MRNWHPPPAHGKGELALAKLLQDNSIRFESQVPIKTPFNTATFICDYVLLDKPIILEVDGGLHRKTWHGRLALKRMAKDQVKTHCLEAYGYTVLRFTDTDVLKFPDNVLSQVQVALKL